MKVCDEMLTPEAFDRHWRKRSTAIIQRATWALRAQELLSHGGDKGLSLWVKRQALQTELYRGIPTERVDPMMIPRSDLELLYRDAHANSAPRNAIELQAEAERAMMQQNTDGLEQELLRHMLPVSSS